MANYLEHAVIMDDKYRPALEEAIKELIDIHPELKLSIEILFNGRASVVIEHDNYDYVNFGRAFMMGVQKGLLYKEEHKESVIIPWWKILEDEWVAEENRFGNGGVNYDNRDR